MNTTQCEVVLSFANQTKRSIEEVGGVADSCAEGILAEVSTL